MSSPLATINNRRPRWCGSTVVVAWTLRLGSAHSLVEMGSLRTATALHRCVAQSAARVRSRQGAAGVVAGLHSVEESLVLLTWHICGQQGHARFLSMPSILLKAFMAFQKPYRNWKLSASHRLWHPQQHMPWRSCWETHTSTAAGCLHSYKFSGHKPGHERKSRSLCLQQELF